MCTFTQTCTIEKLEREAPTRGPTAPSDTAAPARHSHSRRHSLAAKAASLWNVWCQATAVIACLTCRFTWLGMPCRVYPETDASTDVPSGCCLRTKQSMRKLCGCIQQLHSTAKNIYDFLFVFTVKFTEQKNKDHEYANLTRTLLNLPFMVS